MKDITESFDGPPPPPMRIPRNYESIEKGALSLDLKERVDLRNKLSVSIDNELKEMKLKVAEAEEIVNGK